MAKDREISPSDNGARGKTGIRWLDAALQVAAHNGFWAVVFLVFVGTYGWKVLLPESLVRREVLKTMEQSVVDIATSIRDLSAFQQTQAKECEKMMQFHTEVTQAHKEQLAAIAELSKSQSRSLTIQEKALDRLESMAKPR